MCKISVIVPIYNAEDFLNRCINSVIGQTYENIELILINDGSTDNSEQICKYYVKNYSWIKLFTTKNSGVSAARNFGIRMAVGEFIYFLDADDYLNHRALYILISNQIEKDADIVIGDYFDVIDNKIVSNVGEHFNTDILFSKSSIVLYVENYLMQPNRYPIFSYTWGNLFRKSIIDDNNIEFNEDMSTHEDLKFNFDFLCHINKVLFITDKIHYHFIHNKSESLGMCGNRKAISMFQHDKAFESIENYLSGVDISDTILSKDGLIGQAYITYTIVQLIRVSSSEVFSKKDLYKTVKSVANSSKVKKYIKYYRRNYNDSKIIPILLKLGLIRLLIYFCKRRGLKRYDTKK